MVTERADITVTEGRELEFEAALQRGSGMLLHAPGCTAVTLSRCIERPSRYELAICWDTVDHHTAFTRSDEFKSFRDLVGPFFSGRPQTEHYRLVHRTG